MSDTKKTLRDYQFHFTHGEPLYLTVEEGRDSIEFSPNLITVTKRTAQDYTEYAYIHPARLNGYTVTEYRIEAEEQAERRRQAVLSCSDALSSAEFWEGVPKQ